MSRLTAKNSMANFNKLNERGYVVDLNNTKNISKYEDTLGLTSLQEALSILINNKSTDDKKADAINDLILIRLILSGKIQFKSSKFAGLITKTVGKGFEGIKYRTINGTNRLAEELITNLDKKPGEEPKIFKLFLTKLLTTFITSAGLTMVFHALGTKSTVYNNANGFSANAKGTYNQIVEMRNAPMQTAISPNGTPITYSLTQTPEYHQLEARLAEQESKFSESYTPEYFGMILGKQLINQGTIFAPLIIGLLSSIIAARAMTSSQNATIRKALVKMIDRYMIIDEEIFRILNESGTVPKVFENDGPAMALYNRYIRSMRKEYDEIKIIRDSKKCTGYDYIPDKYCFCLEPLTDCTNGSPYQINPCKHAFHKTCIEAWKNSGTDKKCPMCNGPIDSLDRAVFDKPTLPNLSANNFANQMKRGEEARLQANANNSVQGLNANANQAREKWKNEENNYRKNPFSPGRGGTRKKRSNKKSKLTHRCKCYCTKTKVASVR
jgi:hypothetical protein